MSDSAKGAATGARRPLLLGHRGCRGAFPENTIAAFDHALASGCDGFEFDVRLTGDGKSIICHDGRLSINAIIKTAYGKLVNRRINSRASLLRRREQGEACCLDDVLARYSERAFFYIELKVGGLEEIVLASIQAHRPRRFVVASFLPKVIKRLRGLSAELPIGFIFDNLAGLRRWRELPVSYVMPHYRFVTERRLKDMHTAGKQVMTWTVNGPRKMRQLAEWGIDGIISDDPVLLSNTLGSNDRLTT
jgi:glycerophosphoryl diester phosphodiesterase